MGRRITDSEASMSVREGDFFRMRVLGADCSACASPAARITEVSKQKHPHAHKRRARCSSDGDADVSDLPMRWMAA